MRSRFLRFPAATLLGSLLLLVAACGNAPAEHVRVDEEEPEFVPLFRGEPTEGEDTLPGAIAERLAALDRPPRETRWDDAPIEELARPAAEESVCQMLARRTAEFAMGAPDDAAAFLQALQEEVVAGTDDPFELESGLREGRWNRDYFYAGHGGFRPEFDDSERYPRGGNHQPGHFVSVLSIAARFGETPALIALAHAGDYAPGEEDDLRLSLEAIDAGVGLREGELAPADVARRIRGLCR
jgi:hypothetical protein